MSSPAQCVTAAALAQLCQCVQASPAEPSLLCAPVWRKPHDINISGISNRSRLRSISPCSCDATGIDCRHPCNGALAWPALPSGTVRLGTTATRSSLELCDDRCSSSATLRQQERRVTSACTAGSCAHQGQGSNVLAASYLLSVLPDTCTRMKAVGSSTWLCRGSKGKVAGSDMASIPTASMASATCAACLPAAALRGDARAG